MATDVTERDLAHGADEHIGLGPFLNRTLAPLASLRLTVALFAMAIFIILAGTFAQVDKDIWQVIDEYFRTAWAWIDLQIFFPPSFFPSKPQIPGGFYFPGGWLIGSLMALNLLAAHLIRFKVQAKGWRLISGLLVTLAGIVLTTAVVLGGNTAGGLQGEAWIPYQTLWWMFLAGLAGLCALSGYGWWRLKPEQRVTQYLLGAAVLLQGALLGYLLSRGAEGRLSDSAMRILWQLSQGGVAGVVLLIGCILIFKKRGGIVLLHGGVGLLMFGELLVGLTAVEGQLQMQEGETVNFVQDIRTVELSVVDRSDAEVDRVTVIPKETLLAALKSQEPIRDERLPFTVKVREFFQNASLEEAKAGSANLADRGLGLTWRAENVRPGSGTDTDSKVDLSAAYVSLETKDGQPLGTYLVSLMFSAAGEPDQTVQVGDQAYDLALRFRRTYKPYKFQLVDVREDTYMGTTTARNYSSDVRLVDPTRNVDRTLRIWMNNPLRFAGETFYQSGFHRDRRTQAEGTTLQVVTNTGWMIPYVSCMIVSIGMLAHFAITLLRFLQRTETSLAADEPAAGTTSESRGRQEQASAAGREPGQLGAALGLAFPAVMGAVALAWAGVAAMPPRAAADQFDLYAFGKLPVVYEGRAKPLDTLARNSLLAISSKQAFKDDNEQTHTAIQWLADTMTNPERVFHHPVFRIENLEVQQLLGIERREGFRYAPAEFLPKLEKLTEQAELAHKEPAANLSVYQKKVLELEKKLGVFDLLLQSFSAPKIQPERAKDDLMAAIGRQQSLARRHPPLIVPPDKPDGEWDTFAAGWTKNLVKTVYLNQKPDESTEHLTRILVAYAENKPDEFNKEVAAYRDWLREHTPNDVNLTRVDFEAYFNHMQPFSAARGLYVLAFALGGLGWLFWTRPCNRAALAVALVAFAVHCFALGARIYISGRPPVTNLYSAAVFIGWGCAGLGLLMNLFYRNGVGTILAAATGFLTLGVANHLASDGDTFVVLQAVLDTQFWLATHVTCITFGYATTYLAGLLGVIYILRGVCTPTLTPDAGRDLNRMMYGTLCFSIFFSFVGTVLGGLWADDSWGRFWGWDPKENGALIIVLWNALALHARWGALVKERGLAVLAVLGNIAVSWSFFGVNELGVGLHSYGFREGMLRNLGLFALSQLAVAALGLVPTAKWWSMQATSAVRRV